MTSFTNDQTLGAILTGASMILRGDLTPLDGHYLHYFRKVLRQATDEVSKGDLRVELLPTLIAYQRLYTMLEVYTDSTRHVQLYLSNSDAYENLLTWVREQLLEVDEELVYTEPLMEDEQD